MCAAYSKIWGCDSVHACLEDLGWPLSGVCVQTTAEGEAKAADVAAAHLTKQLAQTQKALASKQKDAGKLEKVSLRHSALRHS